RREQLENAKSQRRILEAASAGAVERHKHVEEELASLRRERDALNSKLTNEQLEVAESRRQAEDLQSRLSQNTAELERVKAELETAKAQGRQLETASGSAVERARHVEAELTSLRRERDALNGNLTAEQLTAAESRRQAEDLQSRLRQNTGELERVKVELEKQG